MHGKDFEISQGLKMLFPNRKEDFIEYKHFGFNIIIERIDNDYSHEKYESGEIARKYTITYSDDALIYQSILIYSIDFGTDKYFRSRGISKEWIIDNCSYYNKIYIGSKKKTKKESIPESINPRITACLEKLRYLELLESRTILSDNKEETVEYRFTIIGRLIGLLLKYMEKPTVNLVEEIYKQTILYYENLKNSNAKFCLTFFRECFQLDKRLFERIIITKLLEILQNATPEKNLFLNQLRKFQVFYNHPLLWRIFKVSLIKFKKEYPEKYYIFLYELKLIMETIQEYKVKNRKGFEEIRFKSRDILELATLEGYCKVCRNYSSLAINLLQYFESLVKYPNKERRAPCTFCDTNESGLDFEIIE
jgi:hypothetical protein